MPDKFDMCTTMPGNEVNAHRYNVESNCYDLKTFTTSDSFCKTDVK